MDDQGRANPGRELPAGRRRPAGRTVSPNLPATLQKISPLSHTGGDEIELYGGQPNKQAADVLTTFDTGRMIWNGYTGTAGWMLRQAFEGVVGAELLGNEIITPDDLAEPRGDLRVVRLYRNVAQSPFDTHPGLAGAEQDIRPKAEGNHG